MTDDKEDQPTTAQVITLKRPLISYKARPETVLASGLEFSMSGTLDGFIDFAVLESNGRSVTYSLTCDDARMLIAALHSVVNDIQTNCLFDRDPLLIK